MCKQKEYYTLARRYEFYVLLSLPLEHEIHIFLPPFNCSLKVFLKHRPHIPPQEITTVKRYANYKLLRIKYAKTCTKVLK